MSGKGFPLNSEWVIINISYVFFSTSHIIEIKTHASWVSLDNNDIFIQSMPEKTTIGDACFKKENLTFVTGGLLVMKLLEIISGSGTYAL